MFWIFKKQNARINAERERQPVCAPGGRSTVIAFLLFCWAGGFSNLAFAQMGFTQDPICGIGYGHGHTSASAAQGSENGTTNKALEYDVKAALLYHCIGLAHWPANSESPGKSATIIGLLGEIPFRNSFNRLSGKTVCGHKLVVKQFSNIRKATGCQVVFISASEQKQTPLLLQNLAGLPVLTVGETPEFTGQGGMIAFLTEGKHIRLEVNAAAAAKAGIILDAGLQAPQLAVSSNKVFQAHGLVREISADFHKAVIRHEAIPGYMPAMTMEFNVRDTNELSGVSEGDSIAFRLTATEDTHWIDGIRKVAATTNPYDLESLRTAPPQIAELKPGDELPDYELIAENGKTVRISSFRGKAVAFTFIFTRCPLPDFCPRMGNNFAKAREIICAKANAPTNWQFLSISFDPDFDKPSVLSTYAEFYRDGNADRWMFAAAPEGALAELVPRLDLLVNRDSDGSITHNLRTVVLDPQGRIHHQFNGNNWTPKQLAESLMEAAGSVR